MTWRTALYLITVLFAVGIVAATAMSGSSELTVEPSGVLAVSDAGGSQNTEDSGRLAILLVGVGAIAVTYRQAWKNFRRVS